MPAPSIRHHRHVSEQIVNVGGTEFPDNPGSYETFFREDLGLEFFFDGTRWVSSQLLRDVFGIGNVGASTTSSSALMGRLPVWGRSIYVVEFHTSTQVGTPNSGSDIWAVTLITKDAADSEATLATFSTLGDTVNEWVARQTAVAAVVDPGTTKQLGARVARGGSAGTIFLSAAITYRLIAT